MKFSISQTEFNNALSVVLKGISSRSTLPILSGVYIETRGDSIILESTDLELSVKYQTTALIDEPGTIVAPGKLLAEIVKNLPDAAITIESQDDEINLYCDSSSYVLKGLNAEDFPNFPQVETDQEIKIPFTTFSSMVKKVSRVVSKDESRAILTGVLISYEENELSMVATDSYRLAITRVPFNNLDIEEFSAVISGSFLNDIASLPNTGEDLLLALSENQVLITYGNQVFINRRIEGNYPNYKQLLPSSFSVSVKLPVNNLVSAVRRASLLGKINTPIKLDIDAGSQNIEISSVVQDIGSSKEVLKAQIDGEDCSIAFNYSYILDGLNAISEDEVLIELQSSLKPGIFRTETEDNYLYLIMPVRLS
jgi:DNA polymerase-3 subunit beta